MLIWAYWFLIKSLQTFEQCLRLYEGDDLMTWNYFNQFRIKQCKLYFISNFSFATVSTFQKHIELCAYWNHLIGAANSAIYSHIWFSNDEMIRLWFPVRNVIKKMCFAVHYNIQSFSKSSVNPGLLSQTPTEITSFHFICHSVWKTGNLD